MAVKPPKQPPKITDEQKAAAEEEIRAQSKRIDFYMTEYSIEILANKMSKGDFVVPAYQREFTWEAERKSRFIESVVMGLPIPFIFFWEMESGKLEIVDGSQRLRTIQEFLLGGFRLSELESLPTISGFAFSDLPESRQLKIQNRSIRGIVLHENADEQARFDMFERINTGSKVANKAEVRRGALAGPFMDMVIELAKLSAFDALAPMSKTQKDEREGEELVIRFFAYGDGLDGYKDRPSEFIFRYAKRMNAEFAADAELGPRYRQRFVDMLNAVRRHFPDGFRRVKKGKATPRARFEAISIGTWQALQADPTLAGREVDVSDWVYSQEFRDVTGADGANAIARLRDRTGFVRAKLLGN